MIMCSLCVEAIKENLSDVIDFVTKQLGEDADEKIRFEFELICEEIFVNICSYAYGEKIGEAEIKIDKSPDGIVIKFIDGGKEFDPLKKPNPDIEAPLEDRCSGGLGIFITKKLSDRLLYKREDGRNVLTVIKATPHR